MADSDTKYDAWLGKTRSTSAFIDPWPAQALHAVLDIEAPDYGEELPSLWHWLYFLETADRSQIGADGHPKKGGFLPPVENPRRMFAGGRATYHQPLIIGKQAELLETVAEIKIKTGGQGEMVIVTVRYEYSQNSTLCISEERDFIYLPAVDVTADSGNEPVQTELRPIDDADWSIDLPTDPTLLLRFSALTFNSHRIHYDLEYAQQQEGYPSLVVHGPLSAILLSETVRKNSKKTIKVFSFRAMNPLFCGQTVRARSEKSEEDNTVKMIAYTPAGKAAMKATIELG